MNSLQRDAVGDGADEQAYFFPIPDARLEIGRELLGLAERERLRKDRRKVVEIERDAVFAISSGFLRMGLSSSVRTRLKRRTRDER